MTQTNAYTPSLVSSIGRDTYHIEGSRFHMIYRKSVTQRSDSSYIEITDEDESNIFFSVYASEKGDTLYVHPERASRPLGPSALREEEALTLLNHSGSILGVQDNAHIIINPRVKLPPLEMHDMLEENKTMYQTVKKLNHERASSPANTPKPKLD